MNVGQELLPSLLHTARCYKIKGLDNVQTPPGLLEHNVSSLRLSGIVIVKQVLYLAKTYSTGNRFHFRSVQKCWWMGNPFRDVMLQSPATAVIKLAPAAALQ